MELKSIETQPRKEVMDQEHKGVSVQFSEHEQLRFDENALIHPKEDWEKELKRRLKIAQEFVDELSEFTTVEYATIAGSTATGQFHKYSDIDLWFEIDRSCYILSEQKDRLILDPEIELKIMETRSKIYEKYEVPIDLGIPYYYSLKNK